MGLRARPLAELAVTVDPAFWRGRRVLLTGHTGFKGAWLALWLQLLGARVTGFSLGVPTEPSLYELARVGEAIESLEGDVRDPRALAAALDAARPQVVVHMAAQSLVRRSLAQPRETYEVNVMGTVNLLDALRRGAGARAGRDVPRGDGVPGDDGARDVRVVIVVTSDKCYENREWELAYRESDALGGSDPYSSSKGCAELVTGAYRRSFFVADDAPRLASVRAGNVIGGGDWSADRLVADTMRGALAGEPIRVRNPDAIRPWQHVLNPLDGYLALAQALWSEPRLAGAWNFGPADGDAQPVRDVVQRIAARWPERLEWIEERGARHEAQRLRLDSSRARALLGWRARWGLEEGLDAVVDWYRALRAGGDMRAVTAGQIEAFAHVAAAVA